MPIVAGNLIAANRALHGGGIDFCFFHGALPEPIVFRNTVRGNRALLWGGGIFALDARPHLVQCTVDGNDAGQAGGGVLVTSGSALYLRDSIVANSTGGGGLVVESGTIATESCDVWNNAGGDYVGCEPSATDIACDPRYCPAAWLDPLPLYETSGCQGTGTGGVDIGASGVECYTVPGTFFFDNFSDQSPDGWILEGQGSAGMDIVTGTLHGFAETPGSQARAVVESAPGVWGDFDFRARLRPEWGPVAPPGWIDIFLRYEHPGRCYQARFDAANGELWRHSGGVSELLTAFACPLPPEAWSRLRFLARGALLEAFLLLPEGDESLLFRFFDADSPILYGSIGVGTTSFLDLTEVRFDDVLAALPDPAAAPGAGQDALVPLEILPHPVREAARIRWQLPGPVVAALYNLQGAEVGCAWNLPDANDDREILWNGRLRDGRPAPAGVYLLRVRCGSTVLARKLLVIR